MNVCRSKCEQEGTVDLRALRRINENASLVPLPMYFLLDLHVGSFIFYIYT